MRTIADATTHPTLPSGLKWPVSPSPSPSSPSASSSGSDVPPPLVRTLPSSSDASRRPPKSDTPKSSVRRRGHVGVPASGRVEAGVRLQVPLPSWDMGRPRQRRHSGACHAVHTQQAAVHKIVATAFGARASVWACVCALTGCVTKLHRFPRVCPR
jgi:hypothetical protein